MFDMESVTPGRHLYIIRSQAGTVKIGRSSSPRKRLAELRTGSGHKLTLVKTFSDRGSEEKAIHAACAKYRMAGEWFADTESFRSVLTNALGVAVNFWRSQPHGDDPGNSWDTPKNVRMDEIVMAACGKIGSRQKISSADRYAQHVKRHWSPLDNQRGQLPDNRLQKRQKSAVRA